MSTYTPRFTQKYTIVQFFVDVSQGSTFLSSSWPLHATIVDTFSVKWDTLTLISELEKLTPHLMPATSEVMGDEFFGENKEVHVALLQRTPSLWRLHNDVVDTLEKGGLKLNDPQYARDGFKPHATVQKTGRLQKGSTVEFKTLALVDMFPGEDPYARKILTMVTVPSKRN